MELKELETALKPLTDKVKELEDKNKALEAKTIEKRFEPKGNEMKVEIVNSPEDQIVKDPKGGFKSFGHYLKDLIDVADKTNDKVPETLKNWVNAVKKTAGSMEEGDPAQGGYSVPVQYGNTIYQQALEASIVMPRARKQPMMSNRIQIVADVDSTHATSFFGGVTIQRPGEAGQLSATNPTYQQIALTLHKITGLCHVTNELLEDSAIAIEADVSRKFAQAIAFTMDDDFLNGNGANKPLGALNSGNPAIITVTAVSGQGSATVIAENIRDMYYRMYPQGVGKAVWLANYDVFPQLFGMALTVGAAAVPLWLPAGGASAAPYQTLMGRPLILTEKCQTLGTAGDIAFVDLDAYIVAQKTSGEAPNVATSIHLKFDYDMQSFRFTMRYDGQPAWASALTPKYSSSTCSPFVVLNGTRT